MSFELLGLRPELLRAVADQGYTEPTPVQTEAIPLVLAGRDLLAGAQTGTGKTAAFVLPILQHLAVTRGPGPRRIRTLIIVPTRELALQVEESCRTYGVHLPARSTAIYGGVGFDRQLRDLRGGPEIVVATPGRLLDHMGQGTIDLRAVEILVLDEADRMLDMGFIHDVRKILSVLPQKRQSLLFSATFSQEIRSLASGMLNDPASVQVTPRNTAPELVDQLVIPVDRERKRELLSHLVRSRRIDQALVFTRTKHGANRLAEQLDKDGIAASAIHGNKSQPQRVRALNDFKQGRVLVLVATDIAARGIDIDSLPHVVNFELPTVPEDYVHRIGRTGRAGVDGIAISLVCVDENRLLSDIERLLRHPIAKEIIPGFEPDPAIRPEPIRLRSGMARPMPQRPAGRPQGQRPQPQPRPEFRPRPEFTPQPRFEPRYEERFQPRPDQRPAPRVEARPDMGQQPRFEARPDQGHQPRVEARPDMSQQPRFEARPDMGQQPRFEARPEFRPQPRYEARPDQRPQQRYESRPNQPQGRGFESRPDQRPRYEARPAFRPPARYEAQPDERPQPRYDARPEQRQEQRHDARPNGARPSGPRPGAGIGNRGPAPTGYRNTARRPRPSDWRTNPRPTGDRPAR